jgi:ABC-type multidrug transport system ATPase subunit
VVQEALDSLLAMKRRTTLIVAHRLSTIMNADRIAVHKGGKACEDGVVEKCPCHSKQITSVAERSGRTMRGVFLAICKVRGSLRLSLFTFNDECEEETAQCVRRGAASA